MSSGCSIFIMQFLRRILFRFSLNDWLIDSSDSILNGLLVRVDGAPRCRLIRVKIEYYGKLLVKKFSLKLLAGGTKFNAFEGDIVRTKIKSCDILSGHITNSMYYHPRSTCLIFLKAIAKEFHSIL